MRLLTTVIPLVCSSFVVYDRQYLDEKQSEFLFLLFEVHITFGFKSEVSAFINRCADTGGFFSAGKVAKIICLSKEGLYPSKNKLRPISLLPNLAKWFERVVHRRILGWCHEKNIAVDEQSGFMQGRRLQTRILSLVENMRLTVAACNRPALSIFVDFFIGFRPYVVPGSYTELSRS